VTTTLYPKLGWCGKIGIAFLSLLGLGIMLAGQWVFGLMVLAAAAAVRFQVLPGKAWLRLDEQGFTMRHFGRETIMPWTDVEHFVVITQRWMLIPIRRTVGYRFSRARKRNVFLKAAGAITGFEAQFPSNYGLKAQELAALMETSRERAAIHAEGPRVTIIR
jgi:hypothetical protein